MNEKLQEFMASQKNAELEEVAVFKTEVTRSALIPIFLGIFGVVFVFYIIDLILGLGIVHIAIVIVLFIALVLAPLALRKDNKYEAIYVTPEYLIQRNSRTSFSALKFNDIERFKVTEHGIVVQDKQSKVVLGLSLERDDLDLIIDILEAKGKTFDPEKEYMIRPIKIHIVDNKIELEDLVVKTDLDTLYEKCTRDYLMLTPGYLNLIIFQNTNVTGALILEERNISIKMDQFEVKDGHPENTKFESIIAQDCVVIFQNVNIRSMYLQNRHDKDAKDEELEKSLPVLIEQLKNAVVTEWKSTKNSADFYFAIGVHLLKVSLVFENVIVGWNKTK